MSAAFKFPENFLWGTATSPTQVEGHVVNEWTDYVAADGGNCRVACNHYHRYEEDVDWMAQLGVIVGRSAGVLARCVRRPRRTL
jgi:beta-glucosidase